MQTVMLVFHGIGVVVTLLNLFTFLALLRRIRLAFPRRARARAWAAGTPATCAGPAFNLR